MARPGLRPFAGDEIIWLGAVRIVNARLLTGETFEQLVDADRPLSPGSVAGHGITPDLLAGQPRITEVLPCFHRFAEATVMVSGCCPCSRGAASARSARRARRLRRRGTPRSRTDAGLESAHDRYADS